MKFCVNKKQCFHVIEKNLFILWMLTKGTEMHMIYYLKRHVNMLALCSELASLYSSPTHIYQDETPTNRVFCPDLPSLTLWMQKKKKKKRCKRMNFHTLNCKAQRLRLTDCNLHLKATWMFVHVLINKVCTPKYKWSITRHTYFLYHTLAASF